MTNRMMETMQTASSSVKFKSDLNLKFVGGSGIFYTRVSCLS